MDETAITGAPDEAIFSSKLAIFWRDLQIKGQSAKVCLRIVKIAFRIFTMHPLETPNALKSVRQPFRGS